MSDRIYVAEIFRSLQGEGLFTGTCSTFIRFFGCNFQCAGFSMPKGERSNEHNEVSLEGITDYKQLPLVRTGCDSYASWDKRFRHLSMHLTVDEIVEKTLKLSQQVASKFDEHIIITGGEPLLVRNQGFLPEVITKLRNKGYHNFTFETNGTQKLSEKFFEALTDLSVFDNCNFTFSISAKLPVSGEKWEKAIRPDVVKDYVKVNHCNAYFKFVCQSIEDFADVEKALTEYRKADIYIPTYIMPEGGTTTPYFEHEKLIADECLARGYRFSERLQVRLYKNAWGT